MAIDVFVGREVAEKKLTLDVAGGRLVVLRLKALYDLDCYRC